MSILKKSWSSFSQEVAKVYLDGYGAPSERSKELVASLLRENYSNQEFRLADFGCGNGHMFTHFQRKGLNCSYLGCDFSTALLAAGRERYTEEGRVRFVEVDIEDPNLNLEKCDIILYSHVLEMLQSPERSLLAARRLAPLIMIRFFEPPVSEHDIVEIRRLDNNGDDHPPYLRRTISRDYYNLLLNKIGCRSVEVHQVKGDKDQVHLLRFES